MHLEIGRAQPRLDVCNPVVTPLRRADLGFALAKR